MDKIEKTKLHDKHEWEKTNYFTGEEKACCIEARKDEKEKCMKIIMALEEKIRLQQYQLSGVEELKYRECKYASVKTP